MVIKHNNRDGIGAGITLSSKINNGGFYDYDDIYFTDGSYTLYSMEKETQEINWKDDLGSLTQNYGPLRIKDTVYMSFPFGDVAAFDVADGSYRWKVELPEDTETLPVFYDDRLFVGGSNYVASLDSKNGDVLWSKSVGRVKSPCTDGTKIYFPDSAGNVEAYYTDDGDTAWSRGEVMERPGGTSVVVDDLLFVSGGNASFEDRGEVFAFDTLDGSTVWSDDPGGDAYGGVSCYDGDIYTVADPGVVYSYNKDDGSVNWTYDISGDVGDPFVIRDGFIYLTPDSQSEFYKINASDGTGEVLFSENRINPPVVGDEIIYTVGGSTVRAHDIESGDRLWSKDFGESTNSYPTTGDYETSAASKDGRYPESFVEK